jgi:hypothetical protein
MNLRLLLISVGVLFGAVVLLCLGGLGEIELATVAQCSNYLCDTPQTADVLPKFDYAALMREERRIGMR